MKVFKRCGCGRTFTRAQWYSIPLHGVQRTDDGMATYAMELRNCSCRSTLCVEHQTNDRDLLVNGSQVSLEGFIDANEDSLDVLDAVLRLEEGESGTFGGGAAAFLVFTRLPPDIHSEEYVEPEELPRE